LIERLARSTLRLAFFDCLEHLLGAVFLLALYKRSV